MAKFSKIMVVVGILLLLNPGCSKKSTKSSDDHKPPLTSLKGKIVFVSDRTAVGELYSMNSDGTDVKRLTQDGSKFPSRFCPRISPDGMKVAFTTSSHSMYVFNLATGITETIIQASDSFECIHGLSWSQDNKRICFSRMKSGKPPKIWLIDTGTKALTQLTFGEWDYDGYPSWSPKGDRIAFWRQDGPYSYQLYVMNSSGSELRSIVYDDDLGLTDWSTDTSKIAYSRSKAGSDVRELVLINSDGSNKVVLTDGEYPSFSPSGNQIVFCKLEQSGMYQIYRMGINGSNKVKLSTIDEYDDCFPDW